MKKAKIIFVITLLALASLAFASEPTVITYDDSWGQAGFTLEQSDPTGVEVNFSINEFYLDEVVINNENMQNVILPGVFLPNDEGAPDLPGNGRFIAIPQGSTAEMRIISSRTETFSNIELAPAPRIPLETEDGPLEFNKNNSIYLRDAYYPENPVLLSEQTQIRGVDVVTLGITPFQYNPVTKELVVYRDLQVEVNFIGGNGHFGEDRLRSRWWDPMLRDMLLNEQSLAAMTYTLNNNRTREGAEYLVICPDDPIFIAWADSIKAFRTKQGILTVVKTITEVGGNNATVIENYIDDIMNPGTGWDPAPAAILLLGDYGTTGNTIVSPIYNSYCASDNIYADVSGNQMPDVILARMTAQNETHLQTMVTKFLNYERTPPTNPDFYDHPITALGYQTERWFQICSESVAGFWEVNQGKSTNRINAIYSGNPLTGPWSTNQNTWMVLDVFGPTGLGYIPATPGEVNCSWYGTSNDVINGVNNGAFMLQHRDHGSTTGWGEPAFQSSHINSLTNTDLTFVWSINCLTGMYNMAGECFAEKFHRHTYNGENAGALGIVAASEVSYSFVNDTYVWGAYDNMWTDFLPDYGTTPDSRDVLPAFANSAGKYFLQASSWPYNTGNKEVTYNLFHHHGDAFSTVYSEMPQNLTVVHDPVLLSGVNFFNVTADDGSLIALSVDGELIGVGQGTGAPVSITIAPQVPPAVVDIVITKQNYYRYEIEVPVIPPGGPYVVFASYIIDDSAGNGNGVADYGETIGLDLSVNNVGNQQATNVVVNITSADPYVTITDGTEIYGNIDPNTIVTVNGAFSFEVANDVPDGHIMLFDLEAIAQDTWYSTFSIDAFAPILGLEGFLVDDTATGNGDYLWDPGETVDITVTIENSGSSDAYNVFGELTTTDPYITLNTTGALPYGDLIYGSNADQSFNATSAANTPEAYMAPFNVDITADLGITGTGSFAAQIGGYLIEENFGTFPPAGWTTSGGNNWGGNSSSNAGGTAPEARFNWSPSTTAVQRMISLPINTTGSSTLELEFKHSIDHFSGTYDIRLETTSDGNTWNIVQSWPAANLSATTENIIIDNNDVGSSTFQLAWVFDGYSWNINYWYVDDVILGGGPPAQTGTVAGTVTDNVTGLPIEDADIAGLATSGVDGTYSFDIAIGTYNFTCSAAGYSDLTIIDVEVLEGQTTTVNFELEPMPEFDPPENVQVDEYYGIVTWEPPGGSIFFDDFDSYTAGEYLCTQTTDWIPWSGTPGGADDAYVSDEQAYSGANSVKIEGAASDIIHEFGNLTAGHYSVSFQFYVAAGCGGYFNLMHDFTGESRDDLRNEWAIESYFASDGTGYINAGGSNSATFTYPNGAWFECLLDIDLDGDQAEYSVDGVFVHGWQWSLQSGGSAGMCQLGVVDFFAAAPTGDTVTYYFDDFEHAVVGAEPSDELTGYNVWLDDLINPVQFITSTTELECALQDYVTLIYEEDYIAGVSAVYDDPPAGGESDIIWEPFTFTPTELLPPENLVATVFDYNDVHLEWEPPSGAGGALWSQMDNPGTDGGISAQDFEAAYDTYDAEGADDFVIPAGETWMINEVDVLGSYSDAGPCDLANVRIYEDNAGMPGTLLIEYLDVAADPDVDGNLFCIIPDTPLTEGTYWISVQGRMDFGTGGQWYWSRQAPPLIGYEFHWQNPLDGFGTGNTTWVPGSTQWPAQTDYDLSFVLYGTTTTDSGETTVFANTKPKTNIDNFTKAVTRVSKNVTSRIPTISNVNVAYSHSRRIDNNSNSDDRMLLGYNIYRDGTEIAEITDPTVLTYDDECLDGGTYVYWVTAVYDNGESEPSNEEGVTVILYPPQNLSAVVQGINNVFVTWDAPAERDLEYYNIYRNGDLIGNVTSIFYLDINVPAGTHTYNVTAVYCGDWESGFSDDAEVTVDVGDTPIPLVTELNGNYPNPFNPETAINFALNEAGPVRIDIFNIKGQYVKTLVNEHLEAAYYSIVWDGKDANGINVSSGVYFYKMNAGKYTSTKKMILMK